MDTITLLMTCWPIEIEKAKQRYWAERRKVLQIEASKTVIDDDNQ